jgi:predicted Zn finger-like uncharacterized protein
LFTVCPKCTLTLVVTTVDLRAGQGYVRCGRCANVFNALIALREGDPAGGTSDTANRRLMETAPKSVEPAPGVGVSMDPEPEPEPEVEVEQIPEPEQDAVSGFALESQPEPDPDPEPEPEPGAEPSLEFDATATDVSEIFISPTEAEHDTASGNYEAVVLQVDQPTTPTAADAEPEDDPSHVDTITRGEWSLLDDDEPVADDESVIEESPLTYGDATGPVCELHLEPDSEPDPESEDAPAVQPDPAWVEQMFAEAEAQAIEKITRDPAREPAAGAVADDDVPAPAERKPATAAGDAGLAPLFDGPARPRPSWRSIAGVAGLVVLLGLQIAHFNRRSLALSPTFGPMVSSIYGWFGVTVKPRWDLTAYSVRQLGAESEGAEGTRLRVRVSLHNESTRVQPFPLLRLTLLDRFNNPVGTRDIEPAEYLPKSLARERLLEPDQRIDAEVHVLDPAKSAMGFVIDACLRGSNGSIGCTADARARAPKPAAS